MTREKCIYLVLFRATNTNKIKLLRLCVKFSHLPSCSSCPSWLTGNKHLFHNKLFPNSSVIFLTGFAPFCPPCPPRSFRKWYWGRFGKSYWGAFNKGVVYQSFRLSGAHSTGACFVSFILAFFREAMTLFVRRSLPR
jgi:hypothetical protein